MESAAKVFFSSPRFAVAGASTDPSKFGYQSKNSSFFVYLNKSRANLLTHDGVEKKKKKSPCLVPSAFIASDSDQS